MERNAEKIAAFKTQSVTRSRTLCTFSKDAKFCENKRTELGLSGNACMCDKHQTAPRFLLARFRSDALAIAYSKAARMNGYNANVWQGRHVIIGPTALATNTFVTPRIRGFIESHLYEDVLMLAMRRYKLNLDHIIGRVKK
jgi:hypothetical protein